jgi:serine/threonine protein kinase
VDKVAGAEPLPGYRLLEPLGQGGFGEVWKCEAPGGLLKAIKFVHGADGNCFSDTANRAEQELRALQHVKSLRHPFLLSLERVEHVGGELVIVMELADSSLHDLLAECRAAGLPGVPRLDLLLYLREAAEVLDLMNLKYGLQHLDIKPRNLFLVHQHVKVADFGLVNSLAELTGQNAAQFQLGAITPLYASPESFQGKISLFSDQYSLAISYCELLTGKLPFDGKNFRQIMLQHTQSEPDLGGIPEGERPAVARALAKDPRGRFPSSMEFVRCLLAQEQTALPSPPPETASPSAKESTKYDICLAEKAHTRAMSRPTPILERPSEGERPGPPAASGRRPP